MANKGFEETKQAAYELSDAQNLVGQFRRLGPDGPAYEIMSVDKSGDVKIEIVYSGEKVICKLDEVVGDPIAETIP